MKIAIIGAGFTGLSSAFRLIQEKHNVTVFEKDSKPGGLAIGYKENEWEWTLEEYYHHWFTNDHNVLNLAKEIKHNILIKTPETNWYVNDKIYKFISLYAALTFPLLTPPERIRQLISLGILRFNPFWQLLEQFKTNETMPILMGRKAYDMLWKSILVNKFGKYANDISLAWFWARIKKRTESLAYPEGGFLNFAQHLAKKIEDKGGKIFFGTEVKKITNIKNSVQVEFINGKWKMENGNYDVVVVTLPSIFFIKIAPQLPEAYKNKLTRLRSLGVTNMVLRLNKPFFNDNTYWLSVADTASPIMAIVEHTNFMDKKYYNNEHLVYLGNYLSYDDPIFSLNKEERLKTFDPFLKKINPDYRKFLIDYKLFKAPYAQPIIPTNYSKLIPPFTTPLPNVYLANIEQVYPWDRGTNYAVELGEKVAKLISNS